jgi:hypothetical protein
MRALGRERAAQRTELFAEFLPPPGVFDRWWPTARWNTAATTRRARRAALPLAILAIGVTRMCGPARYDAVAAGAGHAARHQRDALRRALGARAPPAVRVAPG